MENIKLFDIGYDNRQGKETVLDLVRLIPDSWLCACGVLRAPLKMVESGKVSPTVGYFMENNASAKVEQFTDPDIFAPKKKIAPDDLYSLVKHQKLPRSVRFSSFDHPKMPLGTIKAVVPFYIEQDYTGGLFFYKKLDDNKQGPAGIFIVSRLFWYGRISTLGRLPRKSVSGVEIAATNGEFPDTYQPVIKVVWDDQYGGKPEDVEGIITVCKMHNLREEILPFVSVS
ncbi:MAG: hypothetical protein A2922_02780 [Candidatus Nealsonbacteria bacterium RIFCSPLOWO2_01_FULL_43_36]|nr:MAG: hypothetical protein A2922_02780 [Candidatus Nealsonbacteria bacterium RIFCSPLOWO2_01_FULL_43_36]